MTVTLISEYNYTSIAYCLLTRTRLDSNCSSCNKLLLQQSYFPTRSLLFVDPEAIHGPKGL